MISIAAPIRDADEAVVAAISVAYPRGVGPQVEIAETGELVMAAAMRISASLRRGVPENKDPERAQ